MADKLDVTIGGKNTAADAQEKVRDALKKQIQEQLSKEIAAAGSPGGIKPAIHGKSGVST